MIEHIYIFEINYINIEYKKESGKRRTKHRTATASITSSQLKRDEKNQQSNNTKVLQFKI